MKREFRFWCQKVLPLVYDDSLSYYELLCKVVNYLNSTMQDVSEIGTGLEELKEYVDHYFDSADFTEVIDQKLDEMASDGTLAEIINQEIFNELNNEITAIENNIENLEMLVDYVTPEMFGAVGDGVADDTLAVQSAFDNGNAVCFSMDKVYKLTDTVVIRDISRVSKVCFSKGDARYASRSRIYCSFDNGTHPIFLIQSDSYTFDSMCLRCDNHSESSDVSNLTLFKSDRSAADIDFSLVNCVIVQAGTVMDITGRGFLCLNCNIVQCDQLANIKWGGTDTGGHYHNDAEGQRAYIFRGNRCHSIRNNLPFIDVVSGNLFGFEFTDNIFDRGFSMFLLSESDADNWLIANNTFIGMHPLGSDSLMEFRGNLTNSNISNNNIYLVGNNILGGLIYLATADKDFANCVISGNVFNYMTNGSLIIAYYTDIDNVTICNNVIGEDRAITSHRALLRGSGFTANNVSIVGNVVGNYTKNDPSTGYKVWAIYGSGSPALDNVKVIGNSIYGNTEQVNLVGGSQTETDCLYDWNFVVNP